MKQNIARVPLFITYIDVINNFSEPVFINLYFIFLGEVVLMSTQIFEIRKKKTRYNKKQYVGCLSCQTIKGSCMTKNYHKIWRDREARTPKAYFSIETRG